MAPDPPATPAELAAVSALIDEWAGADPFGARVEAVPAERRWLVRLQGEDKAIITVWLTLRERSLHYETYFMPAPEENVAALYDYLLRVSSRLIGMRFAIGDEDAVYLMGQLPVRFVDTEELDRIIGSAYAYTEQYFRAALSIGFASQIRASQIQAK